MAQGYIESSNIGISTINSCKALHTGTAWNKAHSSINDLRNWFRNNIGSRGGFKNWSASGERVDFSDFSGTGIYGFYVQARSETPTKYQNNNNGWVTLWAYGGNENVWSFRFYLEGRGWVNPSSNNSTGTAFHSLNSGTYTVHVEHLDFPRQTFYINIGYGGDSNMDYYYTNSAGNTVRVNRSLAGDPRLLIIDDARFKVLQ